MFEDCHIVEAGPFAGDKLAAGYSEHIVHQFIRKLIERFVFDKLPAVEIDPVRFMF